MLEGVIPEGARERRTGQRAGRLPLVDALAAHPSNERSPLEESQNPRRRCLAIVIQRIPIFDDVPISVVPLHGLHEAVGDRVPENIHGYSIICDSSLDLVEMRQAAHDLSKDMQHPLVIRGIYPVPSWAVTRRSDELLRQLTHAPQSIYV